MVLASAAVLGVIGILVIVAAATLTQTPYGRGLVRRAVMAQLNSSLNGRIHIGEIGGNLLTELTIDSLELRDPTDSIFVATGPIRLQYDPRDILDRRLLISHVEVERPVVKLARGADGEWNFRRVFGRRDPGAPRRPRGSLGDVIVADSVVINGGEFTLAMPWRPNRSLSGAARDSAIAFALARDDEDIRMADTGYVRRWRWSDLDASLRHARISHPDSAGQRFVIAAMNVVEHDPPFDVRDIRGDVQVRGDSVILDVERFALPGSFGSAEGRIVWGSDLPVRYDIRVRGDSVSLADVAWIYGTLPREGGGSTLLHIRNNENDLGIVEYALSDMDVRSTGSRLRGTMTYGVGAPELIVSEVNLRLDPVDFALLETLGGGPFPLPWRGTLTGEVRGPGGPLDRFRVDTGVIVFRDANVPGAITRGGGKGMLDITSPADAVFRGFSVDFQSFDLRTAQFLNEQFPRLRGMVAGTAILDSIWTDLYVSDLAMVHSDEGNPRSHFTGAGRVTLEESYVRYDLSLQAAPLSFTTLSRSYPAVPLRGSFSGPLEVQGTIADLAVRGRLTGISGTLELDAVIDGEAPAYAASGSMALEGVDFSTLLDRLDIPPTSITTKVQGEVSGSSGADMAGQISAILFPSFLDRIGIDTGSAALRFGNGRMYVDTLSLRSEVAIASAGGALGIAPGVNDSLAVQVMSDSLQAWRRYLAHDAGGEAPDAAPSDTISGSIRLNALLHGTLANAVVPESTATTGLTEGLSLRAGIAARSLTAPGIRAARLTGEALIHDLRGSPSGTVSVRADTGVIGRFDIASATGRLRLDEPGEGRVWLDADLSTDASVHASAAFTGEEQNTTRFYIDSLVARVRSPGSAENAWELERPSTIVSARSGLVVDTLALRGPGDARLLAAGSIPVIDSLNAVLIADRVPLMDVGSVAQVPVPLDGTVSLTLLARGVRDAPRYVFDGRTLGTRVGDLQISELRLRGDYDHNRLTTEVALAREDTVLLRARADIPMDLSLLPREQRILDEPLSGYVQAQQVGLAAIEPFVPGMRDATGMFTIDARLDGTPFSPRLDGALAVAGGAATIPALGSVRVSNVNADLRFLGDSLDVVSVTATSGEQRTSSLLLRGGIGFPSDALPRLGLELQLRDFHVVGLPRLADLDVSTTPNLRMRGPLDALVLTGGVRVERGTVYLPELTGKQVIALDDPELYTIVDTTRVENRTLLPAAPSSVTNLTLRDVDVVMGDEVWLRGPEANVSLGGRLRLTSATAAGRTGGQTIERLALDGALTADRGTYRLNFGVVQRTFEIEQGTVRFFGEPEFNPALDIRALYTVRRVDPRAAQPDVRIRATIGGTLADPELNLQGADDTRLTESDALSYLVLGVPSLQVGGVQRSNQQTATALAISSLGSYLTDRAAGGLFDYVTFQTGGLDYAESGFGDASQTLLAGSRLGLGLQVSDRAFVSLDAGLCQVVDAAYGRGFRATDFAGSLGVKLDYRLSQVLIFSAGVEPGASALYCRTTDAARGFAPTPQQWTFDLFRTWRF